MSTTLITTDSAALERERAEIQVTTVAPVVALAEQIEVIDTASAESATAFLVECARASKTIEERRKRLKDPIVKAGREVDALFKELAEPVDAAIATVKPKVLIWREAELSRIAAENAERERIEREAREAAEAQRRAVEDNARQEREVAAREAARLTAEAQRTNDEAAKQKAAEAAAAEAAARLREQVASESQPITQIVDRVEQPSMIKSGNGSISFRRIWKFEVVDASRVPRKYLVVDEKKIRAAVKDGTREITGVRIYSESNTSMRAT